MEPNVETKVSKNKQKRVRSFLRSSFQELSQDCFHVDVESVKKFLAADRTAYEILSAVLDFKQTAAVDLNWAWWSCSHCHGNFPDSESHSQHVSEVHLEPLSEDVSNFLHFFNDDFPQEWRKKLVGGCWEPVDVDTWDVSGDINRITALDSIRGMFEMLIRCRILHVSHLDAMLDYAMGVVGGLLSPEMLKTKGVDRNSILCFQCLGAPELAYVQEFLTKLLKRSKARPYAREERACVDRKADITYNSIRVCLDHDGGRSNIYIHADNWFRLSVNCKGDVSYSMDAAEEVVSWLYDDTPSVEDAVDAWIQLQLERKMQCDRLYQELKVKFKEIQVLHGIDKHWMRYKDALQKVEVARSFEGNEAEQTIQRFAEILEEWKEHLCEEEAIDCTRLLKNIFKEAESIKKSQDGPDDFIRKRLAKEREISYMEFHLIAARVQNCISAIRELNERLATLSLFDHLTIIMPILKRFLRVKWESESKLLKGHKKPPAAIFNRPFIDLTCKYKMVEAEVGKGAFGKVHVVTEKRSGKTFACKLIKKGGESAERILEEVEVMHYLSGIPFIIDLWDVVEEENRVYLIMEFCEGDNFYGRPLPYPEERARQLFRQLIVALYSCHSLGVIHRDLKPHNVVFVNQDLDASLKLIDFGCSAFFTPGLNLRKYIGSNGYMSPQILRDEGYGPDADIWSAGVLLYTILSGDNPFSSCGKDKDVRQLIRNDSYKNYMHPPWLSISNEAKDLVDRLLVKCSDQRISAIEILEHKWISCEKADAKENEILIKRMRKFCEMTTIKRVVLKVISKMLFREESAGLRKYFAYMNQDIDHNRGLARAALQDGFNKWGVKLSVPEVILLMDAVDLDGDGFISEMEFVAATMHVNRIEREERVKAAFNYLDRDKKRYLVSEDWRALQKDGISEKLISDILTKEYSVQEKKIYLEEFESSSLNR